MSLHRLVYRSSPAADMTWGMVSDLIATSQERNRSDGITGLLLWTGPQFLQVLEGPRTAVSDCYHRIVRDPRHIELELVAFESVPQRLFPDWQMKAFQFRKMGESDRSAILQKYGAGSANDLNPDDATLTVSLLLDIRAMAIRGLGSTEATTP